MKKNYKVFFAAIAALIVLCAFWGCSSSDDDDGPSLPEGFLGDEQITIAEGVQVYKDGSEYKPVSAQTVRAQFSQTGASYAALDLGSIDTDGILTLNLPVFTYWSEIGGGVNLVGLGLTVVPPDVKVVMVEDFPVDGRHLRFRNKNSGNRGAINYIYANKDAHISGQIPVSGGQQYVNLILKKGWSSSIIDFLSDSPASDSTSVIGNPGDGFKWVLEN
jgi:hypothetical protein